MLTNRDYEYYVICLVAFGCFLIVVSVFGCVAVCRNNVCLITMVRETETDQHKYKIDIRSEVRIHYVGYCIYSAAHRTFGQESGGEKLPGRWNRGGLATGRFKTINWGTYGYRTDESEWKITFFFMITDSFNFQYKCCGVKDYNDYFSLGRNLSQSCYPNKDTSLPFYAIGCVTAATNEIQQIRNYVKWSMRCTYFIAVRWLSPYVILWLIVTFLF